MGRDGFTWDLGTAVLTEYDADGFLGVQLDHYGDEPGTEPLELHSPYGFLSRPPDPDADGRGCQAFYAWDGQRGHALLSHDPRTADRIPRLKKGGSVQYCGKGGFGLFDGDDDTYTLYVPTDFDGAGTPTKAHVFTVGKDGGGKRNITLLHADGMRLSMLDRATVIANVANDAWIKVGDAGVDINGNTKISGNIGPGAQMQVWTTAVQLAMVEIAAAGAIFAAAGPVPPPPAVAAYLNAITAIATLLAAIPPPQSLTA
jgi:hypothetical protein